MSVILVADKLRASLLQAAIQGKLTEQQAEDGNARDLLKAIQIEKERLIQEGSLKKEKSLPTITDDEKPFDIPESWVWVRFKDVVDFSLGKTPTRSDLKYWSSVYPWVSISDMVDGGLIRETKEGVSEVAKEKVFNKISLKGTLLMSFKLTIGKVSILDIDAFHNEAIISIFPFIDNKEIFKKYLMFVLPDIARNGNFNNAMKGNTLNKTSLSELVLPLPPLAEQNRIVGKLEEALAKIGALKTDETLLYTLQKAFPNKLRASLLQAAIQGELTEQIAEEGNAQDLLKNIQIEKERLVKEGLLKKEKPLPAIKEDEIPFDIPKSWVWVRLGDISTFINGDRSSKYPKETDYVLNGIPFFGAKDMINYQLSFTESLRFISLKKFIELRSGKLQNLDLVCLLRGSIGKYAVFNANKEYHTGFINAQMVIIRLQMQEIVSYLEIILRSLYFDNFIKEVSSGTAVKQLSAETLRNLIIPLPPLIEQRRIVTKLEALYKKLNELSEETN